MTLSLMLTPGRHMDDTWTTHGRHMDDTWDEELTVLPTWLTERLTDWPTDPPRDALPSQEVNSAYVLVRSTPRRICKTMRTFLFDLIRHWPGILTTQKWDGPALVTANRMHIAPKSSRRVRPRRRCKTVRICLFHSINEYSASTGGEFGVRRGLYSPHRTLNSGK
jgi:hypothetical protein